MSSLCPRHDEDLREPLVRRQGSQVSMRVARGSASWLSSHGRGLGSGRNRGLPLRRRGGQGPHLAKRWEPRGFSRVAPGLETRFPARRREERGCGPVTGKDRASPELSPGLVWQRAGNTQAQGLKGSQVNQPRVYMCPPVLNPRISVGACRALRSSFQPLSLGVPSPLPHRTGTQLRTWA